MMQFKSFVIGFVLCVLISLSSLYSSMRMGVLAWPTLFVSLICFVFLARMGKSDMRQVTLAHTLASSGSMVAGAIAYTLPGFWIASGGGQDIALWQVLAVSFVGVFLGVMCTSIYKRMLVDKENLDYPIGQATYLTLREACEKGGSRRILFVPAAISAFFTIIRDWCGWIRPIYLLAGENRAKGIPSLSFWPSLMAMSIGALLTPKVVLLLFASAFGFQYLIFPLLSGAGGSLAFFSDTEFLQRNIAIGLILGSGCGIFLKSMYVRLRNPAMRGFGFGSELANRRSLVIRLCVFLACAACYLLSTGLNAFSSIVLCLAILASTYLSARLTGESGINPMEVFAYISFIVIAVIQKLNMLQGFLIMISVTVACGLTGDIMNDFKSGVGFGVDGKRQSFAELVGALVGVAIAVFAVFHLKSRGADFGGEGSEFIVPQAKLMGKFLQDTISGTTSMVFVVSLLASVAVSFLGVNAAIIGLGIYLPFYITLSISLGQVVSLCVPKKHKENVPLIASGLLTGEGIVSMIISFFSLG